MTKFFKIIKWALLGLIIWFVISVFAIKTVSVNAVLEIPPEPYTEVAKHPLDMDVLYTPKLDDTRTLRECLKENKEKLKKAWQDKK